MLPLLLGLASLGVLMLALGMFSRAQIRSIKQFGVWVAAIGGLLLALLLILTGRGGAAVAALLMLGPMVWSWVQPTARRSDRTASAPPPPPPPPRRARGMSREEALAVLGLPPNADAAAVREAHRRLMRMAHPDSGGSDWLASRINQARDVLLG